MDSLFESTQEDYLKQHQKSGVDELEELDLKIIKAIVRVKQSYKEQLEKRRCSIFIQKPPTNTTETLLEPAQPEAEKAKSEVKENATKHKCKAITMKGTQCTANAKPGCEFCGRHNK